MKKQKKLTPLQIEKQIKRLKMLENICLFLLRICVVVLVILMVLIFISNE